jgi:hypothetical protein
MILALPISREDVKPFCTIKRGPNEVDFFCCNLVDGRYRRTRAILGHGLELAQPQYLRLHNELRYVCAAPRRYESERHAARQSYSATGNVNPYTGAIGTRNPRRARPRLTTHTGPLNQAAGVLFRSAGTKEYPD